MKKVKFLTALVIFVAFAVPIYAAPPTPDVNVVNEPTVHVGSMPDVNIVNTTDVNVTNATPIPVEGDVTIVNDAANPVPVVSVDNQASNVTHMGQPASNHVTLISLVNFDGGCPTQDREFVRVLPDGTLSSIPYRVPSGKVLVVTDVEWVTSGGLANRVGGIQLLLNNLATPSIQRGTFLSFTTLNGVGEGGRSEHMTTGFIVSSEVRICPSLPTAGGGVITILMLQGYLAPDE